MEWYTFITTGLERLKETKIINKKGTSSGSAFDYCLGSSQFRSWPEHQQFRIMIFFYFSQTLWTNVQSSRIRPPQSLPHPLQLIICRYPVIQCYLVWVTSVIMPITLAEGSEAWTIFTHSNTEIMGSNPTGGMDVYCVYCCLLLCVYSV
jgi:hypothetical protein